MSEWPTVSVVVLNYNGVRHLPTCFESLLTLDYPSDRLELICVDNGSSDGSVELMQDQFPQVRLVETGANLGFAGGNNAGARAAQGEVVAFLNNDTRVPPDWLQPLIRPLLQEPEIACTGSKIVSWDGRLLEFGGGTMNFLGYGFQEGFGCLYPKDCCQQRDVLFVCGGALAIRRDLFLETGGFDEDFFAFYEDSDLGWRLWILGHRVLFVPGSMVCHRHHSTVSTVADWKRRFLYERNALFSIVKNYEDETLARVLPVALMLLLKRAYYMTGTDAGEYRIAPETADAPIYSLRQPENPWTFPYYARETVKTLFQDGPAVLTTRAREELKRRLGRSELPYPSKHIDRPQATNPDFEQVPRNAIAHLLAADDLIRYWPRLMEKRAWVQAHRRRSDAEVIKLFGRTLQLSFLEDEYEAAQGILMRAFGLDEMLGQEVEWPPKSS
jgi:GT2 family glycosyltransferase